MANSPARISTTISSFTVPLPDGYTTGIGYCSQTFVIPPNHKIHSIVGGICWNEQHNSHFPDESVTLDGLALSVCAPGTPINGQIGTALREFDLDSDFPLYVNDSRLDPNILGVSVDALNNPIPPFEMLQPLLLRSYSTWVRGNITKAIDATFSMRAYWTIVTREEK